MRGQLRGEARLVRKGLQWKSFFIYGAIAYYIKKIVMESPTRSFYEGLRPNQLHLQNSIAIKKKRQFSIPLFGVGANNKKLRKPESLARTDQEFF